MYEEADLTETSNNFYFLFFDLETSGLHYFSQVLSISFLLTNKFLIPLGAPTTLLGRVSRLELPQPNAIATNHIKILDHQKNALDELDLAQSINNYIKNLAQQYWPDQIYLTAHNLKFDLQFLRTLLIRNGINPYYGNIKYLDSLDLFHKIAITSNSIQNYINQATGKLDFSLAHLSQLLLPSDERLMLHDSAVDVETTKRCLGKALTESGLDLAKLLADNLIPDDNIHYLLRPNYSANSGDNLIQRVPYVKYFNDRHQTLLINLDKYPQLDNDKKKEAVKYYNLKTSLLTSQQIDDTNLRTIADNALASLGKLSNISAFFDPTKCDIEQHIFRLDINMHSALAKPVNQLNRNDLDKDPDFKTLALRKWLREFDEQKNANAKHQEKFQVIFKQYIKDRYQAGLKIDKFDETQKSPSLTVLEEELENLLTTADAGQKKALDQLKDFYDKSEIKKYLSTLKN